MARFSDPRDRRVSEELQSFRGNEATRPNVEKTRDDVVVISSSSRQTHPTPAALLGHRGMVLALAIFVVMCIVSSIILQQLDHRAYGFSVGSGNSAIQYSWKFGPTAVFVLVLSVWRQVDYHIKTQAPWKQMTRGFASADKTVLLDYILPIQPVTVVKAMRNRHWEVLASAIVFIALKLAVFFSTGLLNAQPVMVPNQTAMLALDGPGYLPNRRAADSESIGRAYIAAFQQGLDWPVGTSARAAYQGPSVSNNVLINTTATADVKAIYPWFECEPANASFHFQTSSAMVAKRDTSGPVIQYQTSWSSASASGSTLIHSDIFCDPYNVDGVCPESQVSYSLVPANISGTDTILFVVFNLNSRSSPGMVPYNSSYVLDTLRTELNLTSTDSISATDMLVTTELPGYGWVEYVDWISVLACKARYAVETGTLTSSWSTAQQSWLNTTISANKSHTNSLIQNYTFADLAFDVVSVSALTGGYVERRSGSSDSKRTSWFELMLYTMNDTRLETFKDTLQMMQPADTIFRGLASTWIGSWIKFPDHTSTESNYSYAEIRLRVSNTALWLMQASLIITLLCLGLLLILDWGSKSFLKSEWFLQDAINLRKNSDTLAVFKELGAHSETNLTRRLRLKSFRTNPKTIESLTIHASSKTENLSTEAKSRSEMPFWSTWSSQLWYVIMLVSLALLIIAMLEVLQHKSDSQPRGMVLQRSRSYGQSMTSFATTSVLLTLSTLFSGADFTTQGLMYYLRLAHGKTPMGNIRPVALQQMTPVAMIQQLRLRQYGATSVAMSAFLGSILTIIGSGLYTIVDDRTRTYSTTVATTDAFNLNANISSGGPGALAFTFLQLNNASFSSGTYDEFAFPKIALDSSNPQTAATLANSQDGAAVSVEIDVVRASLNCSRILASAMTLEAGGNRTPNPAFTGVMLAEYANVTSSGMLSDECQITSSAYANSDNYSVVSSLAGMVVSPDGNITYGAEMENVNGILRDNATQVSADQFHYFTHFPPGCPSVAFTIGSFKVNISDTTLVTRMVCSQYWEEIPSTLTFSLPELELDYAIQPPIIHEERARVISDLNWNFTNIFGYQAVNIERPYLAGASSVNTTTPFLDAFFSAVVYGIDGVPIEKLIGQDKYQQFQDAVQHTYRQYMAQIIGNDMRVRNTTAWTGSPTSPIGTKFSAIVTDTSGVRIIQNSTVKIVLQSTLAAMIIFLLAGYRDLRVCGRILTHNPFHIAGRMSFLADSRFVQDLDVSKSENELMQQHRNTLLRLGWWRLESDPSVHRRTKDTTPDAQDYGHHADKVLGPADQPADQQINRIKRKPLSSEAVIAVEAVQVQQSERWYVDYKQVERDRQSELLTRKLVFGIDSVEE